MGKQARRERREESRIARQRREEAEHRAASRLRRRPFMIVGGVVVVVIGVVLGLLVSSGANRADLPASTKVFAEKNHQHVNGSVIYDRTPPAGGAHNITLLNCGIYSSPVPNENAVHSLEHGAVWITYRPDFSSRDVSKLIDFVNSNYVGTQRYFLLSPFPGLPAPVIVSAWGAQLRLQGVDDPRLLAFVKHFAGAGQGGEKGAACTGGTGSTVE